MNIGIVVEKNLDQEKGGVEVYTYNLIKNLLEIDKENKYFFIKDYKNNGYPRDNEIKINLGRTPARKVLKNSSDLPRIVKKYQLDIIHDPAQMGPFLLATKAKKILTVHDIFPIIYPDTSPSKYSYYIYKYLLPQVLKRTDRIITDSKSSKQDLIRYFKISDSKIKVIPIAANGNFYLPKNKEKIEKNRKKYNLNEPFILFVGTLSPRKNISTLLKAFGRLKNRGLKHKLVIAGQKGWRYKKIFKIIKKLGLKKEIIFSGYVPDEDLPYLYSMADLFILPSLYEGFGIPVLEAMACGCPVIISNISSLPEVAGDAALLLERPEDDIELSKKIYNVLTDDNLRQDLVEKGLIQAQKFSWQKTARKTLEIYKETFYESTANSR